MLVILNVVKDPRLHFHRFGWNSVPCLTTLNIQGHSISVPEGPQENSPGWSAAEPWDRAQNEPQSRRDVRTKRIFMFSGCRAAALATAVAFYDAGNEFSATGH